MIVLKRNFLFQGLFSGSMLGFGGVYEPGLYGGTDFHFDFSDIFSILMGEKPPQHLNLSLVNMDNFSCNLI